MSAGVWGTCVNIYKLSQAASGGVWFTENSYKRSSKDPHTPSMSRIRHVMSGLDEHIISGLCIIIRIIVNLLFYRGIILLICVL